MTLEEARKILVNYNLDNGIHWLPDKCLQYIHFNNKSIDVELDGEFSVNELEAIVTIMRASND